MKQLNLIISFCILQFAPGFIGMQFIFAQDSSNMQLLYHWEDTTLVGSIVFNNVYNEIWGYAKNGREYAIIGSTAGTHIFDVTDPNSVDTIAFIPGAAQGGQIIHRDYHDYAGYLYIVSDEGASTLQIADLGYLPDSVPLVYDSDILIKNSHNIFIDTATAKLYALAMDNGAGFFKAMGIFSLADPVNPTILPALILQPGQGWHVHDAYVKNDTAYCSNGMAGLFIFDLTNPASPQLLGSLTTYPDQDYNHSGWLTGDGNYYVFTDEAPAMDVKIYDVSDLSNMVYVSQFNSGVDPLSMAHNVIIKGNYAYCSYYHDGLQIFDISDPSNPVNVGYYDTYTPPDHVSYRGAWGVYPYLPSGKILISDMQYGLFVLALCGPAPLVYGDTICYGQSTTITVIGATTINWYSGINDTTPFFTGLSYTTPPIFADTTFYVANADSSCESFRVPVIIKVTINPTISMIGSTMLCAGDSLILTANIADSYQWNTGETTQSIIVTDSGSYYVVLFDSSLNCGVTSDTIIVNACLTGIMESPLNNIVKIYPNPFSNKLNIKLKYSLSASAVDIYLYNYLGVVVYQLKEVINKDLITLELYDLPVGLYSIRITDGIDYYSLKIIKYKF
ncbi:MAG: choice-of-anchor B family protein [Cytophagales bacterium]|nr:choice-of-anchor B family protein [Cytophagales bacterium]